MVAYCDDETLETAATTTAVAAANYVIAADSGVDAARRLGLRVEVVIGDMDSVSDDGLRWAIDKGAEVLRVAPDKNETDLELALELAAGRGEPVHVVMGSGGRVDHGFANLAVLASPRWADVEISASVGAGLVHVVRSAAELDAGVGETISVVAIGADARIESSSGFKYDLAGLVISPTEARGVSNVVTDAPQKIALSDGVVLIMRPEPKLP